MASMKFVKYAPHQSLRKFIDFYYVLETGPDQINKKIPLFADAGSDVLINCSSSPLNFNNCSLLMPGKVYMAGAATAILFVESFPCSTFVGVRFRPGGLSVFYPVHMKEISNKMIEFQDHHFCSLIGTDDGLSQRLNKFYLARCKITLNMTPVIDAVFHYGGNISVDALAHQCSFTHRTLERLFDANVGVTPKEFINIVRFQTSVKLLQKANNHGRLQQIAYEMGYYDLAHFINDIKKHSGLTPSKIWDGTSHIKYDLM